MSLTHKEKLLSQSELLSSLLDFISQDDRNVILNWDKRLRSDWVEQSYRLNEKDFVLFDAKRQYKLLKNISWIKTLDKIKELALKEKQFDEIAKWMDEKIKDTYINVAADSRDCDFANNWLKK